MGQLIKTIIFLALVFLFMEGLSRIDRRIFLLVYGTVPYVDLHTNGHISPQWGFMTNPYSYWNNRYFNRYGFVGNDNYQKEIKTHRWRVLVIGDSATAGTAKPEDTSWPGFLENYLQGDGFDVEVVNAAMFDGTYAQKINRFQDDLIGFKPDIVLWQLNYSSLLNKNTPASDRFAQRVEKWKHLITKSKLLDKFYHFSINNDYLYVWDRIKFGFLPLITVAPESQIDGYNQEMSRLIDTCQKNKIELFVVVYVMKVDESNWQNDLPMAYSGWSLTPEMTLPAFYNAVSRFERRATNLPLKYSGVHYINRPENLTSTDEYFRDAYHLTVTGEQLFARHISNNLEKFLNR